MLLDSKPNEPPGNIEKANGEWGVESDDDVGLGHSHQQRLALVEPDFKPKSKPLKTNP